MLRLCRNISFVLCTLSLGTPMLHARDVVGTLLKDAVATFSDSYDLIIYSLRSAVERDLRAQKQSVLDETAATNERIEIYLESKGILSRRDRQPITRGDFSRIVFQRFNLPRGFFTKLFETTSWYFRDAVRLGLFSEDATAEDTMSTREMLSVFTRAETLSRSR